MLRISGPDAFALLALLSPDSSIPAMHGQSRLLTLNLNRQSTDGSAELQERAVVTCFHNPASYTGDNLVEISIHGNPLLLELAIREVVSAGARLAEAGEFTFRAYLNGKIDLIQAEAVQELINAGSTAALKLAQSSLGGSSGLQVKSWQQGLLNLLARIETIHDYASDDLDASVSESELLTGNALVSELGLLRDEMQSSLDLSSRSNLLRAGINIAIIGPPNVGKSTLFNALLGYERALVHHEPGTTRDYLRESLEYGGISFSMIDTAGQRSSTDAVEHAGVGKSLDWEQSADILIRVHAADDSSSTSAHQEKPNDRNVIQVRTRCDLLPEWPAESDRFISVSGSSGRGMDDLRNEILARSGLQDQTRFSSFNQRQASHIANSLSHVRLALTAAGSGMPLDAIAQDIHLAREALMNVTQSASRQDVVDNIFGSFCVGK